jgi:drug/metabolite transporter (DMT)-like permease
MRTGGKIPAAEAAPGRGYDRPMYPPSGSSSEVAAPPVAAGVPPAETAPARAAHPWLGYSLIAAGAAMFALNGNLARFLLDDGVSALHLSALRSLGSFLILLAVLVAVRPALLRVEREDVPALAFLGVFGLAAVHATYFLAIARLNIGVAVTIQYIAPVLLLLWLWLFHGRRLALTLWAAVALAFIGCFLVARAYEPGALDGLGVVEALAAAVTFAIYLVGSERAGRRHAAATTLLWSFGFALAFWALASPLTGLSLEAFDTVENALLTLAVIVVGTLLPFGAIVAGLRHVPASRGAVVATLEPVLAAAIAWVMHDQVLEPAQVVGALAVVAAVVWVQSHRPDLAAEAAPAGGRG